MKYFSSAIVNDVYKLFPELNVPIQYPDGETHNTLFNYLKEFKLDDSNHNELINYLNQDFKRFVYTLNLVPDGNGELLEIGSNPYFTSMLLRKHTDYVLSHTNYFEDNSDKGKQILRNNITGKVLEFKYENHNIESDELPFNKTFEVVLFCEVLEHLIDDPMRVLLNIKSLLKPGGMLILTTPNVNRLENISKMIAGINIYDPYSGYGKYGRHNREYNKHELFLFLSHLGFEMEVMFSADVHANNCNNYCEVRTFVDQINGIKNRKLDLGQYIFLRAKNSYEANTDRPGWLFRSYE